MEPAEQARLLLERASHCLSGGERDFLQHVEDGHTHTDGQWKHAEDRQFFARIVTEFAAYLVF